jgi:hypothetical protein
MISSDAEFCRCLRRIERDLDRSDPEFTALFPVELRAGHAVRHPGWFHRAGRFLARMAVSTACSLDPVASAFCAHQRAPDPGEPASPPTYDE